MVDTNKSYWEIVSCSKVFQNRKEVKDYLGGLGKFNRLLKSGDVRYVKASE